MPDMTEPIDDALADSDWSELSARAAFASHRLIGWIYWDPIAIENYAALGPDRWSYYIASRGASLAPVGNQAVVAAFFSISPAFVAMSLDNSRGATTFDQVADARDAGVVIGLREFFPEICDDLAAMAFDLWAAADALPSAVDELERPVRVPAPFTNAVHGEPRRAERTRAVPERNNPWPYAARQPTAGPPMKQPLPPARLLRKMQHAPACIRATPMRPRSTLPASERSSWPRTPPS